MTIKPAQRRIATLVLGTVLLLAFIIAGMTLRVPYVALGPGPTVNTLGEYQNKPVVSVSNAVDPEPDGHLNLTTVSLRDGLTLFDALRMWASSDYELQPRELYYKPGQTVQEVQEENVAQMSGSELNATLAALNFLRKPTTLGVGEVTAKGPADGKLKAADRLVSIAGTPVTTVKALSAALEKRKPGEAVDIVVQRGDQRLTETVQLGAQPKDPKKPYLGVVATMMAQDPKTDITFNVGEIGGPSAGLMLTLSVIDEMTPGNLSHGEFIAGTGTIAPDGKVGPIGGIPHKIQAAKDAGATVFLVPAANCAAAVDGAPDGIELVKVQNLTGAMDALASLGTNKARPTC